MPPPAYLLDTNVVAYFLHANQRSELSKIAEAMPLAVVEEVHQELLGDTRHGGEYRKWLPTTRIQRREIFVGGLGAACLGKLRKKSGGAKDLGEHASIALAASEPDLLFVTNDQKAAWLAQRELVTEGERVLGFWAFLYRMQSVTQMRRGVVESLAKVARVVDHEPTWWSDWIAGLPP